ncbi:benzaldehyde dehydrogenase [Prauserella sp. PE36]|uniref:benzaldehyde dehydrogenase n=1 Tax=Prauserella sp. PE36 TaxID=1504709 RepID=UPI000D8B2806|nr:benzaldehyde dehydrogenase [Prauserella sp. PE36]PXY23884.1 benzaldehyde dehydrogenase [Prauserella coralliicola]RBM16807.1 benzaldehyde dehydrogenase [Prauserella sp. PE36]
MSFLDVRTWHGRVFTGSWEKADGGETTVVEPATGEELGRVGAASATDVARSAAVAAQAQRDWATTPFSERAAILRRAGELWSTHAEELRDWLIRESGSIPGKADFELHVAEGECFEASALPSHPLGELLPSEAPRLSMARRVPAGVVGVISPFNAPLILSIRSVAPALALGNAVVLKPDPRTAVCGGVALARVFEEAGLPPGVLHVLPGGAEVGQALVEDPNVRVISFTGSTAAGRAVGELAGRHLKRAHLELGGNSALIVLDDADVAATTSAAAWGSFFHQGQICMTTGRHLVHESIYDEYVERLAATAAGLPVGNPATGEVALGPIIDERQRDKIHALVGSSVDAGASLAAGGEYEGLFYRPTVLAGAKPSVPAYDQEVFGPVAPVARFGTIEEAARLAAASEYGLSLGILTKDIAKGLALADRVPTGIVHINDQTVNDEAHAPFGGVLASGTGSRFGGAAANIEAFTETRWVTLRGDVAGYPF